MMVRSRGKKKTPVYRNPIFKKKYVKVMYLYIHVFVCR